MAPIMCFLVGETGLVAAWLRRYVAGGGGGHFCQAAVRVENQPLRLNADGYQVADGPSDWPLDDPRWPLSCAEPGCGYAFTPADARQVFTLRLYTAPDGGEFTLHPTMLPARPGAVYRAAWLEPNHVGADGQSWGVVLPNGEAFEMDFPSSSGGHWERSGAAPAFTLSPSIHAIGRWHGWLRAGVLTDA